MAKNAQKLVMTGPPKDWTKVPMSELIAEVAKVAASEPSMLRFSKAAKELDRRMPSEV